MRVLMRCLFALLILFTGQAGAEQLAKGAQRIIALAPHIVENLYHIGAGDRIIGTTDHSDYPEAAKAIPRIGNYSRLNIEEILAADPDLIIAWKTGNPSDDIARLQKFGIKIAYSQPNRLEDVAKELRHFGQLTGLEKQANKAADKYLEQLSAIQQQYRDKPLISTFYELWPRPLTTVAKNAWPQHILNVCRASNPFVNSETDYPQIGVEQVVLKAPQVILQPTTHGKNNLDNINWRQWQSIPAVKANAFIHPDESKLHRMTSRSLNEISVLCEQIDIIRERIN